MKLSLVRHGETEENREEIIQGQTLGSLSEKGREQAIKVALRLKYEKFDHVYVSDLQRAIDTAKEILRFHNGTAASFDARLREQNLGVFEGRPFSSLREEILAQRIDYIRFKPSGGESVEELDQRVRAFYRSILERHLGESVLLVTHGGVIITMLLHILGWGLSRYREVLPENTALSVIDIGPEGKMPIVRLLNSIDHL